MYNVTAVNELAEVREEIELQFERLTGWRCYDALTFFALLAIPLHGFASAAKLESERVLPLLRQAFRIDIVIPHQ